MLKIQGLSKSYGGQTLFTKVDLQMGPGERLGLVGRNGHGKTTIFRMILGEETPDEGSVILPRGYRVGHLAQHLRFREKTLLAEGCRGLRPEDADASYKVEKILHGLGFSDADFQRAPAEFSGGYQIRLELAKVLVSEPNLLLLDEPTNYLDIVSIRWITRFLRQWKNELIMISHDREFLDSVSTHSALIHRGRLRKIQGSTEKLYAQIVLEEEVHERTRQNAEKKRLKEEAFITRFRAKASKASAVQSRIKRLEKMPALEKLAHIDELDFSFREAPFFAERMMELRGISFGYQEDAPLFQGLNLKIGPEDRIGVIGKNGKGKSTLLNLMAGELAPLKGERVLHPEVKLGYFGQTNIQRLQPQLTVEAEVNSANPDLGRTVVRTICGTMMFSGDAAEKKISVLSGGEKSRVLLGKILARPSNLLILDEPTNHLDMESIEALLESLGEFSGAVVIVTHSEMILKDVITKLVVFHRGGVEVFSGGYEEFLEKVGWEDEGPPKQSKPAAPVEKKIPLNKKERRRQRAELIAKRSRVLTPLKKEMEALEASIGTWETALTRAQADLIKASEEKATASLIEGTQTVKDLEEKIESAFTHLAALNEQHESQSKEFTDLLEELS